MKYIEFDKERSIVRLSLSKNLYNVDVIKECVEHFSNNYKCTFQDGEYAIVEITTLDDTNEDTNEDPKEIAYEFFNYVLALMKNKAIV